MHELLLILLRKVLTLFQLGLIVVCGLVGDAYAAEDMPVLFLGIEQNQRINEKLTAELTEHLLRIGERPVPAADLRPTDRLCTEPVCLTPLARNHQARLVVGGSVSQHNERLQYLSLWLYDEKGGPGGDVTDTAERAEVTEKFKALCFRLFREFHAPTLAVRQPPPPTSKPGVASTLIIQRELVHRKLSLPRKGLAVALGMLAGVTLAGGIVYTAINGQPTPSGHCIVECRWQTRNAAIAGYTTAGVSLIGLGLTLGLP